MSKIRVYELARDLKVESKVLMSTLKSLGLVYPSHQSVMTDEQVEMVRRAILRGTPSSQSNGATKAAPTSAGASSVSRASDSASSVRVIRRRRAGGEENPAEENPLVPDEQVAKPTASASESNEVPNVTETAATVESSRVEREVAVKSEAHQVAPVSAQEQQVPVSSQPPAQSAATISTDEANPTPVSISTPSTTATQSSTVASVKTPAARVSEFGTSARGSTQTYNRSEDRKRVSATGATIVRKATPEEIQARARQEQQSSYGQSGPRRPMARREDSKGTKYTGFSQPGPGAGGVDVNAIPVDPDEALARSTRRLKEKVKPKEAEESEEAAAIAKKAASKGARRANVNLRQLLSEVDDSDDFGKDSESFVEASLSSITEEDTQARAKTVYMPTAHKRKDMRRRKDLRKTEITVARQAYRIVKMGSEITVGELAHQMKVKAADLIKKLFDQGILVTINKEIDFDTATLLASDFGYEVKSTVKSIEEVLGRESGIDMSHATESRPPIVTVMGHVDHGKTSILDAIRKTSVASGEAGGITQHIGAYTVQHEGKSITFLDTPGHEAFSAMRARGANATDIVVLVVAADDGVMPQTIEAISHARDAKVPVIVAVNKIDKVQADIDRIYRELSEQQVVSEEWGGDTQFVKCSALTKEGIDHLLEAIIVQAEILELKTVSDRPAEGVVVEGHLDANRGPVATILVRHGTLSTGDYLVAGAEFGKVRALHDHRRVRVDSAGPSMPVEVLGLSGVPLAGDQASVVRDEKTAREAVAWVIENARKHSVRSGVSSLEDLLGKIKHAETPELALIVKADTQGSLEAIVDSLAKLNSERVRNRVVHRAVGGISESDLSLAEASGAVVIGFNVRAARGLDDSAEKRGVVLRYFSIIYDLTDSVKSLMAGKLPSIVEEVVIGHAEVRQTIQIPKIGMVAGSSVIDGRITRTSNLRLIRDSVVIYTGKIGSLRRFKEDVREVKSGFECGIGIENYNDLKIGDVVEAYEIKETRPTL